MSLREQLTHHGLRLGIGCTVGYLVIFWGFVVYGLLRDLLEVARLVVSIHPDMLLISRLALGCVLLYGLGYATITLMDQLAAKYNLDERL